MAQPHLGERNDYMTRLRKEVDVDGFAADAGYSKTGRFLADLIYQQLGYAEFMFGPDRATEKEQPTLPMSA